MAMATFKDLAPPLPPPMPDWSPVRTFGGYRQRADLNAERKYAFAAEACGCASACGVHGHAHASAWGGERAGLGCAQLLGRARLLLLGVLRGSS